MRRDVINYRRERAKETIDEAKLLFENDKLFATVNRIYYAVFYEVNALLLIKSLVSSKHTGVRAYFNKEFIKTGIIPERHGRFYNKIFGFRQRSDYEDFVEFNKEQVRVWLLQAEDFLRTVESVLEKLINDHSE